jgi:hypothetical protein
LTRVKALAAGANETIHNVPMVGMPRSVIPD